ncbi:MAG: hypothetical protein JO134_20730 [Xanthobacteraceae bacterium]|nr:hypothetical protein [Xanthobacteraceae bacterium]MBV9457385.1 hypothetical protein [Bradyrhizobium sp.]
MSKQSKETGDCAKFTSPRTFGRIFLIVCDCHALANQIVLRTMLCQDKAWSVEEQDRLEVVMFSRSIYDDARKNPSLGQGSIIEL